MPNNEVIGILEDSKSRIWFQTFNNDISYFFNNKIFNKQNDKRLAQIEFRNQSYFYENNGFMHFLNKKEQNAKFNINNFKVEMDSFINDGILKYKNKDYFYSRYQYKESLKKIINQIGLISVLKLTNNIPCDRICKPPLSGEYDSLCLKYIDSLISKDYHASDLFNQTQFYLHESKNKLLFTRNKLQLVFKNPSILRKVDKNILRLFQIKNKLYFLTNDKEIYGYSPLKFMSSIDNNYALYNVIRNQENPLLVTTDNIFNLKNGKSINSILQNPNFKYGFSIKNALFLGSSRGLYKLENNILEKLIDNRRVYSILIDSKENLWYSTTDSLFYVNKFSSKLYQESTLILNNKSKVFINEIKEDINGNIIIATNYGVYIYNPVSKIKNWLNEDNLLSSNECQRIEIDPKDYSLWITTFNGLNHIKYTIVKNTLKFELINRFFENDGLYKNEINDILIDGDSVWVATPKGLNLIYNKNAKPDTLIIPIYINKIFVNKELQNNLKIFHFNSDQNNLTIEFSAIYYQRRDRLNIKYKLIRDKDTIVEFITENKLNLLALKDGVYTLQLYAYDMDYPYIKSNFESIKFIIKPPFYKTWWFWTGLFFGISSILAISYYKQMIRKKNQLIEKVQVQNQFNELNLKSLRNQMNPHFVFNCLNSIKDFINKNDKLSSNKFLTDFAKLIRTTLNITRKQYIYIEDEIEYLRLYIQLEQMRFDNHFDFEIINEVPIEIYIELPSMMVQPFVENSIRHGQIGQLTYQGHLLIRFYLEGYFLVVKIIDNGVGIEESQKVKEKKSEETKSLALIILNEQIDLLEKTYGQEIVIEFKDLKIENKLGTEVTLKINIEEAIKNN